MKTFRWILVLSILLLNTTFLHSAITIQQTNFNSDNAPKYYVEIEAKQNGTDIPLNLNNVLIQEGPYTRYPFSVELIGNNKYAVEWITPYEAYPQYEYPADTNDSHWISFNVIVSHNKESGRLTMIYPNPGLHFIVTKDRKSGEVVKELDFNNKNRTQISVVSILNFNKVKSKIKLDSISFSSPYFSYNWQGSEFDYGNPPPKLLNTGDHYLVDVFFNPPDDQAYRAVMRFHYNNGMIKTLALIGGRFSVKQTSLLQLIQPNGGEILTPCQTYEIKWKGHSKDDNVIVEYSPNGGGVWYGIAQVKDSIFKWTVPNLPSGNVVVRVRQEFVKSKEVLLKEDWSQITKIAFNTNGSLAIGANTNGKVSEFDIYKNTNSPINRYYLKDESYDRGDIINIGIEYVKNNDEIAYFYKENYFTLPKVSFFNKGVESAYNTVQMNFDINKIYADPQRRFLLAKSNFDPKLYLLSPNDASVMGDVSVNMPITAASFNRSGDSLAIIELDGNISIFKINSPTDFQKIKSLKLNALPITANIKFSPNGKLLAISIRQLDNTNTESYLYDIDREQIVRTYRPAVGAALEIDFSPSSSSLIIGSANIDQVVLYDLTGTEGMSVLSGHRSQLNDMKLDPEGFAILTSSKGDDNFKHHSFSYPEIDLSDNSFQILEANLSISEPEIKPLIIGTSNTYIYTSEYCNNGEVPVYINSIGMKDGVHAKLLTVNERDTILPHLCKEIAFEITPLDTGKITDEIVINSCFKNFIIPLNFISLDRKLTLLSSTGYKLDETCIWTRSYKDFDLFRNDDTVDVLINSITIRNAYTSAFRMEQSIFDTIIKPGQVLKVRFSFFPNEIKQFEEEIYIRHSNQDKVYKVSLLSGKGIGTFLNASHDKLMFIDEIDSREITIENTGEQALTITDKIFSIDGIYILDTPLPLVIQKNETKTLTIKRLTKSNQEVSLRFVAEPCLASGDIIIDSYEGSSFMEFVDVNADPKGRASIEVKFSNYENNPYKGMRFFEGEFSINPRIFLPDGIESTFGTASIMSNEVVGDNRVVKFRIEGDFNSTNAILCKISGTVGLAETKSSPMVWSSTAKYWGQSVNTSTKNGSFNLINICEDRLIRQSSGSIIKSISPNPANDFIRVTVEALVEEIGYIEILDFMGQTVFTSEPINLKIGTNEVLLNLQYLSNGNYSVVLRSKNNYFTKKIIILR